MTSEVERAPAKVNLWLNVVGRRADGYHLLHSLVAFADLADELVAGPSQDLSLQVDGPAASGLASQPDNLVLKAARLLAERTGVPPRANLSLTKRIPVAAGLGGGSADAAAALRALAALWQVALAGADLLELAGRLGADVPMCLGSRAAIVSGVGEVVERVPPLPACGVLLVNPGVALPTSQVFANRKGAFSPPRALVSPLNSLADLAAAARARGNDLTVPALSLCPVIADVLGFLRQSEGAVYAAMSGSGASCFALYRSADAAERAAGNVPAGWWRHAGRLGAAPPA